MAQGGKSPARVAHRPLFQSGQLIHFVHRSRLIRRWLQIQLNVYNSWFRRFIGRLSKISEFQEQQIMIDHVTIKVKDLKQSKLFYESAFGSLGYKIAFGEEGHFYAFDVGNGCLFEIMQYEGEAPITSVHVAFRASDRAQVLAFFDAAIAAGGTDNGKPGPRPHYTKNYYACFVLDPDGHNIELMHDSWD